VIRPLIVREGLRRLIVEHRFMTSRICSLTSLVMVLLPTVAVAQVKPSEHGSVSQQVSSTTITLEFDRPGARGRALFGDGKVVRWGETWTPGANWATTIEIDRDVRVDGRPLPKGKYSIWLIPQAAPAPWTVIFSKTARRFHTRPPSADDEQLRVAIQPEQGAHMETLAWYFPIVTPEGATLRMQWGTTVVPMQIGVDMPQLEPLPPEQRERYVGNYRMHVTPRGRAPYDVDLAVVDVDGMLKLRSSPRDAFGGELDLIPVAERRLHVASAQLGSLRGQFYTAPGILFIFDVAEGRTRTIEMLTYDNTIVGRGQQLSR
jgi:hypothetical protein